MGPPPGKDDKIHGGSGRPYQLPPPPASWPAAGAVTSASSINNRKNYSGTRRSGGGGGGEGLEGSSPLQVVGLVPSWSGFDEDFEVELAGRGSTTFFVRVAGRELAATNGVAVVIHGGGFTGMSWAPAAGVMRRDCCVIAPDLRGHGLTSSTNPDSGGADVSTHDDTGEGTRQEDCHDGDGNGDASDGYCSGSGGSGGGDGRDDLMSLESLAEDVKSLIVEIFTSGVLFQPNLPRRQQQRRRQESEPPHQQEAGGVGEEEQHRRQQQQSFQKGTPPPRPPSRRPAKEVYDPATSTGKADAASSAAEACAEEGEGGCPAPAPPPLDTPLTAVAGGRGSSSGSGSSGVGPIKLLLVGHSLGGCIAVRVAGAAEEVKRRCAGTAEVAGVVAVDVVEGTALAALDDMPEILRKIPRSFPSMEEAVAWHVKTGAVRSSSSAHAVVPSRLKRDQEDGERVVWRTDLRATERHWRGWFEGMSTAFLELPVPKLLVVAGMDRLDTELTAAHMQGRFQLKLVYGCGHSVQEDQPDETAASIVNFATRNSIIRRGTNDGSGRTGEEEELRLKLARARGQASRRSR